MYGVESEADTAHEINTPTQFVGDNARFLHKAFQDIERIFLAYDQLVAAISIHTATTTQQQAPASSVVDAFTLKGITVPQSLKMPKWVSQPP